MSRKAPSNLTTNDMKKSFCKLAYPDYPEYNDELDMCVKTCGTGQIYDPVNGECSTLGQLSQKYKNIILTEPNSSQIINYLTLYCAVLLIIISFIDFYDEKDIKGLLVKLGGYSVALYLTYYNCNSRHILLSIYGGIMTYMLTYKIKKLNLKK
jgi:branched-subunit amino acid transport protein AzlD